jgi:predicted alpha/beta-fold hydrolase
MERSKYGGHIGFMFHQSSERPKKGDRSVSWMPLELTRFLSHVHNYGKEEH